MSPSGDSRWPEFDWTNRRVIVTGGAGFLSRHVVARLRAHGLSDDQIIVPRSAGYDLRHRDASSNCFAPALAMLSRL